MSFRNFKPTIWETAVDVELEKRLVFAEDTNQKYTGKVTGKGDSVRIIGVGKPTVTEFVGDEDVVLGEPEHIADTATTLYIDRQPTFNYLVNDVDKAQASGEFESVLKQEASQEIADKIDMAIANLARDPLAVRLSKSTFTLSKDNILDVFDKAIQALWENNVPQSSDIVLTIPPWVYTIFKQAYIKIDTNNSEMLKNGKVAMYGNATVKMSNNVATDGSGNSLIQVKTKNAIAYAKPVTHIEPDRYQKGFGDILKGFTLYGTKIVRPKEMVVIPCTHA